MTDGAAPRPPAAMTVPFRDPRLHQWTWGDILRGLGIAALLTPFVHALAFTAAYAIALGEVSMGTLAGATGVAVFGLFVSLPVVLVYGTVTASIAAHMLERVRPLWIHLVVFGALGALGGGVAGLLAPLPWASAVAGAIIAVVARWQAQRSAIARRVTA